jgi:hypothetical protein
MNSAQYNPRTYVARLREEATRLVELLPAGWSVVSESGTVVKGPNGTAVMLLRGVITQQGTRPVRIGEHWTPQRVAFMAERIDNLGTPECPHGCGNLLQFGEDGWICPQCGDAWATSQITMGAADRVAGTPSLCATCLEPMTDHCIDCAGCDCDGTNHGVMGATL